MKQIVKKFNILVKKTIFKVENKTNSNFTISVFNKYLITIVTLLFIYLFYLLIPTFYSKTWVQTNIKNELLNEFGDRLVDRTTNDYRSLNDWLKNSEPEAQISARPKLMARPVIRDQGKWFLGWDSTVEKAVLGK